VKSLLLASHNAHKLREFERLLPGVAIEPLPDGIESPEETGETYQDNALIKARAAAHTTQRPAFADDSGIEAEALGWRPGVLTARFAGPEATDEQNLQKLHTTAPPHSRARYVCVIAYVTPQGEEHLFEGRCEGTLALEPRGSGGFGYDPAFVADETSGRTMAELAPDDKDAISHRGRAARAFLEWLEREEAA
jgi:XTP/dITP diphosphohydrolase